MAPLYDLQIQAFLQRVAALEREVARLRSENAVLREELAAVRKENAALRKRNAELQLCLAKALKNSTNSSKPPSSDIVKPPSAQRSSGLNPRKKRKLGAQPGHPKHARPPFPPERIDHHLDHGLDVCPCCLGVLCLLREQEQEGPRVQQVEAKLSTEVHEHRGLQYWCPNCEAVVTTPLPPEVKAAGLCGPRLTALVALLKGPCHASFSTIRKFLRDVIELQISRGQLAKLIGKATAALDGPYEELLAQLPWEQLLHVDETGHKENGKAMYTWVFRTATFALFRIEPGRGSGVLVEVLGKEFNGVLGCDYFSAYRKFMKDWDVAVQFCLAHLIRDVKFLTTIPDPVTKNYGVGLLENLRRLFRVIHNEARYRDAAAFQRALCRARDRILAVGQAAPQRREAQNMAARFRKHGAAYFEFITTPGIGPTNNLAEQAIRFVVIDRKITQGTRSAKGRRWCERIWTALATLSSQGRSILGYLEQALRAYFQKTRAPGLLIS